MAADQDPDRRSDLAVMDANEFKQKKRLERILESQHRVEEKANEAWELFVNGEINHDAKNIMIQRAVKEAVREAYKLLLDHQGRTEHDGSYSEYWSGIEDEPIGRIQMSESSDVIIYGLRDFLSTNEIYHETVTKTVTHRNKPPSTETERIQHSVPEDVSWAAFLRLKEFLDDEHDLEISFEEMDDEKLPMIRDFDQSDPESNGNGTAESTDAEYNGPPDI